MNKKVEISEVVKFIGTCQTKKRAVVVRRIVHVYKISERQARNIFNQISENVKNTDTSI